MTYISSTEVSYYFGNPVDAGLIKSYELSNVLVLIDSIINAYLDISVNADSEPKLGACRWVATDLIRQFLYSLRQFRETNLASAALDLSLLTPRLTADHERLLKQYRRKTFITHRSSLSGL